MWVIMIVVLMAQLLLCYCRLILSVRLLSGLLWWWWQKLTAAPRVTWNNYDCKWLEDRRALVPLKVPIRALRIRLLVAVLLWSTECIQWQSEGARLGSNFVSLVVLIESRSLSSWNSVG